MRQEAVKVSVLKYNELRNCYYRAISTQKRKSISTDPLEKINFLMKNPQIYVIFYRRTSNLNS